MTPLLSLEDAACHFRTRGGMLKAVDGVTLAIARGETFALVGESGCGKSTLATLILKLNPLSGGQHHVRRRGRGRASGTGCETLPVAGPGGVPGSVQLAQPAPQGQDHPGRAAARARCTARREVGRQGEPRVVARGLGTENAAGLYPHEFSGGQRQRIAIARALILEPDLVVLDEPISALDVSIRAQILNLLQDLQAELGLTYLLIAHDLALVEHVADRVAVMYLGQIVETGDKVEIFDNPRHPYTQALLAAVPRPDPKAAARLRARSTARSQARWHRRRGVDFTRAARTSWTSAATSVPRFVETGEHAASCHLLV